MSRQLPIRCYTCEATTEATLHETLAPHAGAQVLHMPRDWTLYSTSATMGVFLCRACKQERDEDRLCAVGA